MLTTETEQNAYVAFHGRVVSVKTDKSIGDVSAFQEALGETQADRIVQHPDFSKVQILVADDEQVIANTLTLILNQSGFEACAVYSGEAAIEVVGSFQPDVLISDVVMPEITGIEAAIVIRSQRPSCKVLLFSGQTATADLLQDARMQGHSFEIIAKPVHPIDLLAKLRTGLVH